MADSQNGVPAKSNGKPPALDLPRLLTGKRFVIIGGTGFLGKVFWVFLLSRYPELGRIELVVRPKKGQSAEQRFWNEIATNDLLRPLREQYGAGFDAFLREKVRPIAGDVVQPFCGLDPDVRDELRGSIDALVNASGVVDFDPPLDEALQVNAFGVQNLVALARDLGDVPLMHTSTCFVAGSRTGFIEESDPHEYPFPRVGDLERSHWDPDREISECLDVVEQARHRASDAFRQSHFLDEAKRNLQSRDAPARGKALEDEIEKVKRKFVEERLAEMGMERANFWGFPNTYTYTKGIGEQIVASSGLPYTIVRPAIVESTLSFPFPGWNEGINTSAPLIFGLRAGALQIPGGDNYLDFIPCDMVAGGMLLALAELCEGRAKSVYQLAASDVNPCTMRRFFELTGLYKRRYYQRTGKGGPLVSFVQGHFEGALLNRQQFESYGPLAIAKGARGLSGLLKKAAIGPAAPLLKPSAKLLEGFADGQRRIGNILNVFMPFTHDYRYVFRCDNTRAAYARLNAADKQLVNWTPETIDWRHWFLEIHVPGLEKWVFPHIEERLQRPRRAPERHETLPELLEEMAERYDLAVALQRTEADGLSRISFREWLERSRACAARLTTLGVKPGDRVLLAGANHPAWPIAFFGILMAGATAVPLDATVEPAIAENLLRASGAQVFIADAKVRERVRPELGDRVHWLDLQGAAERGPELEKRAVDPADVAALIYTSGTTGTPKGVMLTHANLAALIASLAPLFPLFKGDRILSVLPLHHTFELTCGLLLPLSRGARVVYLDELTAERLEHGLKSGRITGLVGVPALWEMLERRIYARVAERGALAARMFDFAMDLNRSLGKTLGVDTGRLLFGPVHEALGGHLRFMVSGGAALPERTHRLFAGLGLHLAEGYGLTEAAPVLTVASAGPKAKPGHVGKAIPGVEIRIQDANAEGVGEVLARGPNVMLGYSDDPDATAQVIGADGWLRTGDLGKVDKRGNLVIVGRAKDTIVTSSGENVYPDDLEARIGQVPHVAEIAVVGLSDPRGGERIGCVAVPEEDPGSTRAERHAAAKRELDKALAKLPNVMRPAVVTLIDGPLPRTATRKVKRNEVRALLERVNAISERPPRPDASLSGDAATAAVRAAVGLISRRDPSSLHGELSLRGDLGFDSLMLLELLVALEAQAGSVLDAERLSECNTIAEVEAVLRDSGGVRRLARTSAIEHEEEEPLNVPPLLREAAMQWMGRAQMGFYDSVLRTKVTGRAFLPYNRSTIVAANHASHLDMGLVKYALGSYGQNIVSLAAQDYFFEGNRWRKAYFENFTNLVPMSRAGSLRQSLRQAGELIDQGKTVLIFPEGTRSTDGELGDFKPAVGHLALHHAVDILPVWLGGTHAALPKGGAVLRQRNVQARIGPPLENAELKRLTAGLSMSDASRTVTKLVRLAILSLSRGDVLDLKRLKPEDLRGREKDDSLAGVFAELETRFVAGSVEEPVSFYFAIGKSERWTVKITSQSCEVSPGKVTAPADCVLKTSPDIFTRIVREAYTPSPAEFVAGAVKSNNIGLLFTFQKAFQLQSR
ncbi:MAG TPA: AMP-binding protein [Polyangiaceae bacterium]|nr:AMP-binding protein [Polyangiaceae bacterium]